MADGPQDEAGDPLLEPKTEGGGDSAVENGDRARSAAQQDRLGQRAVDRRFEALDVLRAVHQIKAPPPKLKKERKKDEAAKAIDNPNTIWISRLKPPAVSPNASVRPVV